MACRRSGFVSGSPGVGFIECCVHEATHHLGRRKTSEALWKRRSNFLQSCLVASGHVCSRAYGQVYQACRPWPLLRPCCERRFGQEATWMSWHGISTISRNSARKVRGTELGPQNTTERRNFAILETCGVHVETCWTPRWSDPIRTCVKTSLPCSMSLQVSSPCQRPCRLQH